MGVAAAGNESDSDWGWYCGGGWFSGTEDAKEYGIPEAVQRFSSFRSLVPPLWQATHPPMAAVELAKCRGLV